MRNAHSGRFRRQGFQVIQHDLDKLVEVDYAIAITVIFFEGYLSVAILEWRSSEERGSASRISHLR